jgi:hypothetical protein
MGVGSRRRRLTKATGVVVFCGGESERYFSLQLKGSSTMNRSCSRLLSVAVLFAALPAYNRGAAGDTAVGAAPPRLRNPAARRS